MARRFSKEIKWDDKPDEVGSIDIWQDKYTYLGSYIGRPKPLSKLLDEFEWPGLAAYVATLPGTSIVGYLTGMEVDEAKRGRGIGTEMVEWTLKNREQAGVDQVFLHREQGTDTPDEALGDWYARLGFDDVDCCTEDGAPVMRLVLDRS